MRLGALKSTERQTELEVEDKPPKQRKSKYQSPEYIIVFDDLSNVIESIKKESPL